MPKEKSKTVPLVAAGLLVFGGVGAAIFALTKDPAEVEASEGDDQAAATSDASSDTPGEATADGADGATAPGDDPAPDEPAAETPSDETPVKDEMASDEGMSKEHGAEDEVAQEGAAEDKEPMKEGAVEEPTEDAEDEGAESAPVKGAKYLPQIEEDRAKVAAMSPFPKPEGIDDEAWGKLEADAALVMEGGGASVNRAAARIKAAGKAAFPAGLNAMIATGFTTPDSFSNAKVLTDALDAARGGTGQRGYGWIVGEDRADFPEPRAMAEDLKIFLLIHRNWTNTLENPAYWEESVMRKPKAESSDEG